MIDLGLLVLVPPAAAAGGLLCLRVVGALPADEADWLVAGVAAGFGVAATAGLGLAALDALRPVPMACVGVVVVARGRRILVRALRAVAGRRLGAAWPLLLVCAAVLAAEAIAMVAPPVGGDQTKYQLAYPRLYAAAGGLVPTPWSFWGQMQFLQNFLFAIGFALSDGALARYLNGAFGVLTALALGALTRRHLGEESGPAAAALFFTLPITWSMMTHAGSDMPVVLYGCLALGALLDWTETGRSADVRRAGLMAGLAGASKVMGLLVPALTGGALLVLLLRRALPLRRCCWCAGAARRCSPPPVSASHTRRSSRQVRGRILVTCCPASPCCWRRPFPRRPCSSGGGSPRWSWRSPLPATSRWSRATSVPCGRTSFASRSAVSCPGISCAATRRATPSGFGRTSPSPRPDACAGRRRSRT